MRPDRLTVNLRPRSGYEAIDLGFALVRRHARELWRAWLLLVLPLMLALALAEQALSAHMRVNCLLLWWCKPLYDAVVLLVLSRAVFGERIAPRDVLAEMRRLGSTLLAALTLRRLSLSRSFLLPAHLLEGLRGPARAPRIRLLREDTTASARLLTMAGGWMEASCIFGVLALLTWLLPDLYRARWWNSFFEPASHAGLLGWQLLYIATVTLVEPFYVAAGFALYLNRRTWLEAWDIEVALKRVASRLPAPGEESAPADDAARAGIALPEGTA